MAPACHIHIIMLDLSIIVVYKVLYILMYGVFVMSYVFLNITQIFYVYTDTLLFTVFSGYIVSFVKY